MEIDLHWLNNLDLVKINSWVNFIQVTAAFSWDTASRFILPSRLATCYKTMQFLKIFLEILHRQLLHPVYKHDYKASRPII